MGTGEEALELCADSRSIAAWSTCDLPDMSGFELLDQHAGRARACRDIPVVVFTGKELSVAEEERSCTRWPKSIVLKDVQSPERLLDETALFLHRVIVEAAGRQAEDDRARCTAPIEVLRGRRVLVVDDDVRNIFALTTILENQDMEVLSATQRATGHRDHREVRQDLQRGADGHHDARDGRLRDDA